MCVCVYVHICRLDVALGRAERERDAAELERAEERERERALYTEMERELRTIQSQFRALQVEA